MLFSLQYLAVKDTDLEHALLFSLLKLSIAVLPVRNKACSAVLSLQLPTLHQAVPGHGQQLYAVQGYEVLLAHSRRWAQLAAPPHQEPMPVPVAGQDLKKDISPAVATPPELAFTESLRLVIWEIFSKVQAPTHPH